MVMWLSNFTQHHLSNFTGCKGFLCWNLNIKNLKPKKESNFKKFIRKLFSQRYSLIIHLNYFEMYSQFCFQSFWRTRPNIQVTTQYVNHYLENCCIHTDGLWNVVTTETLPFTFSAENAYGHVNGIDLPW